MKIICHPWPLSSKGYWPSPILSRLASDRLVDSQCKKPKTGLWRWPNRWGSRIVIKPSLSGSGLDEWRYVRKISPWLRQKTITAAPSVAHPSIVDEWVEWNSLGAQSGEFISHRERETLFSPPPRPRRKRVEMEMQLKWSTSTFTLTLI